MTTFQAGETIICSIEVKDDAGAYKDPATSMTITITDPSYVVVVNNLAMTKDAVGKYHYDYNSPSTAEAGGYWVKYTAIDGTRITIEKETFALEE